MRRFALGAHDYGGRVINVNDGVAVRLPSKRCKENAILAEVASTSGESASVGDVELNAVAVAAKSPRATGLT
jgi:hypothetical protein